jgi:hypothetical protein
MSEGPVFLYLHGFASSPGSAKAVAFGGWAKRHGIALDVLDLRVPSFERLLFSAITERVIGAIDAAGGPRARAILIGSSLGGLAAARVAERDARVCAVLAMAPAFELAARWRHRLGEPEWRAWQERGHLEVDDHLPGAGGERRRSRVHFGFVEELARVDAEAGASPDVRVPTLVVHGVRDDVVDVELSRRWAASRRNVRLVEVEDGHELGASVPRILEEADRFLAPCLGL